MIFGKFYQRLLSLFLLTIFVGVQIINIPIIYAANQNFFVSLLNKLNLSSDAKENLLDEDPIEYHDIVAILAPKALYNYNEELTGLRGGDYDKYLSSKKLKQRIDRYAELVQQKLPLTKAMIIQIDDNEKPSDISAALEKLYFEGEKGKNTLASLRGVVLISNFPTEDQSKSIPLPIVNKNGNTFLSMYPYTDFEDKSYIYNSTTDSFEYNQDAKNRAPEIWHGVIMPPVGDNDGLELLASYLDKNYLYHNEIETYSDFDKKLLFHDQFRTEDNTNSFVFKNYLNYTDFWENISFLRYTKELVKTLQERRGDVFDKSDGLDNDGDKKTDEEIENGEDDDNDGLIDEDIGSSNKLDDDQDGKLNEDGGDLSWDDRDKDNQLDEDPYGDLNGDGCPGTCKTDDDGDGKDPDGDGIPTGVEREYGYDPMNKNSPFFLAKIFVRDSTASEFIDEKPSTNDRNCYDAQSKFHLEWDDDEDGFCDEDTGQMNAKSSCHDNDNDCDGQINEDAGDKNADDRSMIEMLPDIFSKKVSETFFSQYYEIYKKFIGEINDMIDYTGRYEINYTDADGNKKNDYDSIINLVTKKDQIVLNFLTGINSAMESKIDSAVNNDLQQDIPLLHKVVLYGTLYYTKDSESKHTDFKDAEFVNHSVKDKDKHTFAHPYILGKPMYKVSNASQCSLYLGDFNKETDAKLIEANKVYNPLSYEPYNKDVNDDDIKGKEYAGCNGEFYYYPQYCFVEAAIAPVFDRANGRKVTKKTSTEHGASYQDCFDFKYGPNFWGEGGLSNGDSHLAFAEDVVESVDDLLNQDPKENYTQEDLDNDIKAEVNEYIEKGEFSNKYTPFNQSYLLIDDKKASLYELIKGIGLDPNNYAQVQEKFFAFGSKSYHLGKNVFRGYTGADIYVDRYYAEKSSDGFTDDSADAKRISSVVYHKEPTNSTIQAQLKDGIATDLPVDNPRYVSFRSKGNAYTELQYPNIFQSKNWDEFQQELGEKGLEIAKLPGGSKFATMLTDIFDEEFQAKVKDAIDWRNMNIDQKYQYVLNKYLNSDPAVDTYDGNKVPNGYEIFYLNTYGASDKISYQANGDTSPETDVNYNSSKDNADKTTTQSPMTDDIKPINLLDWLDAILAWIDTLDDSVYSSDQQSVCGEEGAQILGLQEPITDIVTEENNNSENSAGYQSTQNNKTSSLFIISSKNLLSSDSNDLTNLTVTAKKGNSKFSFINKDDNATTVKLMIENPKNADSLKAFEIISSPETVLVNGQATFKLKSTDIPAKAKIYVMAINQDNLISNKIEIESKKEALRLTIFQKESAGTQDISYEEEILNGLMVKDSDKNDIAEISKTDGTVKLKNISYLIEPLPIKLNKPSRINIITKDKQNLLASIIISFDKATLISNFNDLKTPEKFSDYILIKSNLNLTKSEEKITIKDKGNLLVATIDSYGGVRINPAYNLKLKDDSIFDWLILDDLQNIIAEIIFHPKDNGTFNLQKLEGEIKSLVSFNKTYEQILKFISAKAQAATIFAKDTDHDALPDLEEKMLHTSYTKTDTDGDNFNDNDELANGYDPTQKDSTLFVDLDPLHESYSAVLKLLKRGVLSGVEISSDNLTSHAFYPNSPITREQMVKLSSSLRGINCLEFANGLKEEIDKIYSPQAFPDQNISDELKYCVEFAKNENIISGYKDGPYQNYFVPKDNISRAEAIKIILESAKANVIANTDANLPWYYNYVITAKRYQIYPENRFERLDSSDLTTFQSWFNEQLNTKNEFIQWLEDDMTRGEFAIMVAKSLSNIFDPDSIDTDQDGLNDNSEILQYGTDPNSTDTDSDTIFDYDEIIQGTDPLKADRQKQNDSKNLPDADQDGVNDNEELKIGTDPNNADSDQDGLSDFDELKWNADPKNIDSDGDGLTDGQEVYLAQNPLLQDSDGDTFTDSEEILSGSDPNNQISIPISSENIFKNLSKNLLVVGNYVEEDKSFKEKNIIANVEGENTVYTKRVAADGTSKLYLEAAVLTADGNINLNDNSTIIEFDIATKEYGQIEKDKVQVQNGQANTIFDSSIISGVLDISASVIIGEQLPEVKDQLFIYPGNPAKIDIVPNSRVIPTGGDTKIAASIVLYDQFGNIANDGLQIITLKAEGEGKIVDTEDENPDQDGIQISTFDGMVKFFITSTNYPGNINIKVNVGDNVSDSFQIESRDDLKFNLISSKYLVHAGADDELTLNIKITDGDDQLIDGINIPYKMALSDSTLGIINNSENLEIKSGIANNGFKALTIADKAEIMVSAPGVESSSVIINILPASPDKIILSSVKEQVDNLEAVQIQAKLFDQYGNFAYNNSNTQINFRFTDASKTFGTLSKKSAKTKNGLAEVNLLGNDSSGLLHLIAESNNLISATLELKAVFSLNSGFFQDTKPNALFGSLLGFNGADLNQTDNFASAFTFAGKTEASLSLSEDTNLKQIIASISPQGQIKILDQNYLTTSVIASSKAIDPLSIQLTDPVEQKSLGKVYISLDPLTTNLAEISVAKEINKNTPGIYLLLNPDYQSQFSVKISEKSFANTLQSKTNGRNPASTSTNNNDDENYQGRLNLKTLKLSQNNNLKMAINANGSLELPAKNFKLTINNNFEALTLDIWEGSQNIGQIFYVLKNNQDVSLLDNSPSLTTPPSAINNGISLKLSANAGNLQIKKSKFNQSSFSPYGYLILNTDNDANPNQLPSSNYQSYDSAQDVGGIGFKGDNKHILLFSSGLNLGEATLPYSSEIGILTGDPLIKLDENKNTISATGYDKTIGVPIMSNNDNIQEVIAPFDYDGDGNNDILVAYEDGAINLIQNYGSMKLRTKGQIVFINNGIEAIDKGDFNQDGLTDLIVASKDSCSEGETVCSYIYWNKNGALEREYLPLQMSGKIDQVKVGDLNNDGYPDFVISDEAANVKAFYNYQGQFKKPLPNIDTGNSNSKRKNKIVNPFDHQEETIEGQQIVNLGLKVDDSTNLASELIVKFDDMPTDDKTTDNDNANFYPISIDNEEIIFAYINTIADLAESSKYGVDESGDILEPNDLIKYTIKIKNSSSSTLKNLAFIDSIPGMMDYVQDSIVCLTCSTQGPMISQTSSSDRPFIVQNINLTANSEIKFEYEAKVKSEASIPKVKILLSNLNDDEYLDMALTTEGNNSGQLMRMLSQSKNKNGYISYLESLSAPPEPVNPTKDLDLDVPIKIPPDNNKNGIPDDYEKDSLPPSVNDYKKTLLEGDSDGDGLPDEWDNTIGSPQDIYDALKGEYSQKPSGTSPQAMIDSAMKSYGVIDADLNKALDKVNGAVDKAMSFLTCGSGCLALPMNVAFLVPGMYQVFGTPVMMDPLPLPILGTIPFLPVVCSAITCYPSTPANFRFYISPTLNGGLGTAICIGTFPFGKCWAFAIPIWDIISATTNLDICGTINGAIEGAIANANNAIESTKGVMAIALGGDSNAGNSIDTKTTGGIQSYNLGKYNVKAVVSKNIRVPGFPSVFTDWWSRQSDEFASLLDLPDLIFIYPDFKSITGASNNKIQQNFSQKMTSPNDILTALNKLPLLKIQPQEIVIKLPTYSPEEITRIKKEAKIWLKNLNDNFKQVSKNWTGVSGENYKRAVLELMGNVEKNIATLEAYANLPMQIIQIKQQVLYYTYQILCYVEAIIDFTIGYIQTNTQRIGTWVAEIRNIIKTVKTWKGFINLAVEYQEGCDKCKTQRLTLYQLLLSLFVFIPDIPILDLPKWPNIIIDVSHIQAGLTITWPVIKFEPDAINIPALPQLTLPQIVPLETNLPQVPLLPSPPDLSIFNLPKLPPLSFPKLPNIPPAPTLPKLPNELTIVSSILSKIIKIVCIIRSGFLPTSELKLKTVIEDLTARPLTPVLPIDLSLATSEIPNLKIDFYDLIRIDAFTNFSLQTTFITDLANKAAENANKFSDKLTETINKGFKYVTNTAQSATDTVIQKAGEDINNSVEDLNNLTNNALTPSGSEPMPPTQEQSLSSPESYNYNDLENLKNIYVHNLLQVTKTFTEKSKKFNTEKEKFEKDIYLVADSQNFDIQKLMAKYPLPEIEKKAMADLDSPLALNENLKPYLSLRQELLGYMDKENSLNETLIANQNNQNFYKLLTNNSDPFVLAGNNFATYQNIVFDNRTYQPNLNAQNHVIDILQSQLQEEVLKIKEAEKQLTAQVSLSDVSNNSSMAPQMVNKGIFIYDSKQQINDRLMNYIDDSLNSRLVMFDADNDGDDDIVYSIGPDLYIKFNKTNKASQKFLSRSPEITDLASINVHYPTLNDLHTLSNNDQTVSFNFLYENRLNDFYGYLAEIRKSRTAFDRKLSKSISRKLFILPELIKSNNATTDTNINEIKFEALKGSPNISKSSDFIESNALGPNDNIYTDADSQIALIFADGSQAIIKEKSSFTIPTLSDKPFTLKLEAGEMDLNISKDSSIFSPGTNLLTANAKLNVNIDDNLKINLNQNQNLAIPDINEAQITLTKFSSNTKLTSYQSDLVNGESDAFYGNRLIHTLNDAEFTINLLKADSSLDESLTYRLTKNKTFTILNGRYGAKIKVKSGLIEIINTTLTSDLQHLSPGMMLFADSSILSTNRDEAEINFLSGPSLNLNRAEVVEFSNINSFKQTLINYSLDNGNYFINFRGFDSHGVFSTDSNVILVSPQVCADNTEPYADPGATEIDLSIFKTKALDASKSFDPNGEISLYGWDIDANTDSDNDGDTSNDYEILSEAASTFNIGPYDDLDPKLIALTVFDRNGHKNTKNIKVNMSVPKIKLNQSTATSGSIEGGLNPAESEIPITILRERDGVLTPLETPSISQDKKYFSDENGQFQVNDLTTLDEFVIKNDQNEVIATLNPDIPRLLIADEKKDEYYTDILSADYNLPTSLAIIDTQTHETVFSTIIVPDVNTDVRTLSNDYKFSANSVSNLNGIFTKILENSLKANTLPGDDPLYPGGLEILDENNLRLAIIATNGNIFLLQKELDLRPKAVEDETDPLVIELTDNKSKLLAEIYISSEKSPDLQSLNSKQVNLSQINPVALDKKDSDQDGIPDKEELIYSLNPLDPKDSAMDNDNDELTNLEEYHKGTNPNDPDTDHDNINDQLDQNPLQPEVSPFSDISTDDPIYPTIKTLYDNGVLNGTEESGQINLKPDEKITRVEFTKIMLGMLCTKPSEQSYQNPPVFSDILLDQVESWIFADTKEAFLKGYITGYLATLDTSTGLTEFKPNAFINLAEQAKIITEVLAKFLTDKKQTIITLPNVQTTEPWYQAWINIAEDLTPYLNFKTELAKPFILTQEEASQPNEDLTRGKFLEIADRVFQIYNCYEVDSDHDGLTNVEEEKLDLDPYVPDSDADHDGLTLTEEQKYGTDPNLADTDGGGVNDFKEIQEATNPLDASDDDTDNEGLSNLKEKKYGTDLNDPDTDKGGITDYQEILRGSDPLNKKDDQPDQVQGFTHSDDLMNQLDQGVYTAVPQCNICPCPTTLENTADLTPKDKIYAGIISSDGSQIFTLSDPVEIELK
ncbi:MAG: calcium-binding protein [Candidatus Peregrinibacteria bacterium GW2011_GWF2_33_10]|nr:MAG: calcium-binding protein [Candidatus Peregrinibacteria bacterium GW2011_GWF2_33_10]OGJ44841.1 MAG: hypothetical protein A2263_06420 [Candidatus Peregrinibacteria bacterium RIFOXYA2_FULL_33_21]OGJ47127.1 MAG: hypothetical protein A2272_03140 [Candidatus Peregrinibacteria bacterium RIFOXYA12_FULL_33_12]OGJ50527.1 MAG: hypothetical protein A2307_03045 [Candidatus Peregrinibacteria bacterium RIFOXYB2_FULL_33_20]